MVPDETAWLAITSLFERSFVQKGEALLDKPAGIAQDKKLISGQPLSRNIGGQREQASEKNSLTRVYSGSRGNRRG